MIRINLLPVKAKQRQSTVITQLAIGGGAWMVVLLSFASVNWWFGREEKSLELQNAEIRRDIDRYKKVIGEVEEITKKKEELERKLGIIDQLKRNKTGPVYLLEELSAAIPKKLWLTSVKQQTASPFLHKITLTGEAINLETIAGFMSHLEESSLFEHVALGAAKLCAKGDKTVPERQCFDMSADLIFRKPEGSGTESAPATDAEGASEAKEG